ncbi:MAG: EAL domain-containing protein [Candidatus Lokiarchaeota archaeon]|nr:EAL domain-containing protein [Candidatus Lokiarchaeota archaeon]
MENTSLDKINILIIEDNPGDVKIIEKILSEIETTIYNLVCKVNLSDGIKYALIKKPDIILLDLMLSDSHGLETLKIIREKVSRIPIVVLTGIDDEEIGVQAVKFGAQDYLVKNYIQSRIFSRVILYAIERSKAEEEIKFLAYYDYLTKLPNRRYFLERFNATIASAGRYNRISAILFLDIDDFKLINDSLGHKIGDLLLIDISKRLKKCIRKSNFNYSNKKIETFIDVVARLGGDEFVISLIEISNPEDSSKIAKRIVHELSHPYYVEDHEIYITASIGIALYPSDGENTETLLKHADIAMYQAKKSGKNNFKYFTNSMNKSIIKLVSLEKDLRKALDNEEFFLCYQPKMDLNTGNIIGFEALIRWQQQGKKILLQEDFMSIAEEINLIVPIGYWVIRNIALFLSELKKENLEIPISINISLKQLKEVELIKIINNLLIEYNISKELIEFEISESIFLGNLEEIKDNINEINKLGIKIALDNFGEGCSSFEILKKLKASTIKIGRYFTENILKSNEDASIVSTLISLGHNLNLSVICEGIENFSQLNYLKSKNCDIIQGFLLSRPVPAEKTRLIMIKEKEGNGIGKKLLRTRRNKNYEQ